MRIAAFLDLDGTIGNLIITDDKIRINIYKSSIDALLILNKLKIDIFIITNQSRIERGEISQENYNQFEEEIKSVFFQENVHIKSIYCCPHISKKECNCKKPKKGFIERIQAEYGEYDLKNSYVIGDTGKDDMLLAKNIGAKGILVRTGNGERSLNKYRFLWKEYIPYFVVDDLFCAATKIKKELE
jgi:D-glycero-D-manno-heptose 1,7-bisphosphate phosphatase